jgi:DNA recombination protein RmuC
VVLFLPDEGFLAAAAARDRDLIEHALGKGVVLATPATLYALLGAVRAAGAMRGSRTTRARCSSTRASSTTGSRCSSSIFGKIGRASRRSVDAYTRRVGSLESRVLPQTRRMRELGARARVRSVPERVEVAVREPTAPLPSGLDDLHRPSPRAAARSPSPGRPARSRALGVQVRLRDRPPCPRP